MLNFKNPAFPDMRKHDAYAAFTRVLSRNLEIWIFMDTTPLSAQRGMVIWLLGLSGAGKSTIARLLRTRLENAGVVCASLDGDELRAGINHNLGFSDEDRAENIRRAAEIAKIMAGNRIVTICSLITPLQKHRDIASGILGGHYFEVFVDCPLSVCEERDVKGLYEHARMNGIPNFTGVSGAFEPALKSDLTLFTNRQTPEESCDLLLENILPRIQPAGLARHRKLPLSIDSLL